VALHLGEIAQDDRWGKQRIGRMMALHCRSRAGPVRFSLGKRVPQTRNAQLELTTLHCESSRMNRQKVVLHVARSERSPLRNVFAENEPEGARTEGSGDGEMKYRRATILANDWHGEFGSYDEWARLGPQPPYRTATFFDAHGRRCITQRDFARARDDRAFPLKYRWERPKPRKHT
jgi:hypothetical protein